MSGFKEKNWKKWKESKTTSPVVVTNIKTTDSISSQRSSSLIRSRKRHTLGDAGNNILATESQEIIPRTLIENEENKRVSTYNKNHFDPKQKNDFKNKSTSPFNTLIPTNPFYRENMMIVQYGELRDKKAKTVFHTQTSDDLWGELPSSEVAENSKPAREKGPKGGIKHPAVPEKSLRKTLTPPPSPTHEKPLSPAQPSPQTDSGPSASHHPPPRSGQSQHPRTTPSSYPENEICEFPECPAHGPKQKERLCMDPECPVTLKKAVVKEAKRAMKKSCEKKRKNPLTILGAVFMGTFAGSHDSSCKLTKEEKKVLKRMKQAETDIDDNYNASRKSKKSKGVQCKLPMSQKNEHKHRGPETVNKSTTCDIPECPIAMQKIKIKEFMDKELLCDIPNCPVKELPPRKEKKAEPSKGCPSKPCTLKTKDDEFLKQLDPCIFEKLPRLKMTCQQALADENGKHSRPYHNTPAIKDQDKPSANKSTEKDKGVKIVTAHVLVPPLSENPFRQTIPIPQEFPALNKLIGKQSKENRLNPDTESECQKLVDRRPSTRDFASEVESEKLQYPRSRLFIPLQQKTSVVKTGQEISNKRVPKIRFSNVSVNRKDSSGLQNAPEVNETPDSRRIDFVAKTFKSIKSAKTRFEESLGSKIKVNHDVDSSPPRESRNRLMTSKTLPVSRNGLISKQSSFSSKTVEDLSMTYADSKQQFKDESVKKALDAISLMEIAQAKQVDIKSSLRGIVQDFPVSKSYFLIDKSNSKTQEDKWLLVKDPVKSEAVVPVNRIPAIEGPLDLSTPRHTPAINLLEQNSTASLTEPIAIDPPTKSKAESDCDQYPSKKTFRIENIARVARQLDEAEYDTKHCVTSNKSVISLHLCQDARDNMISEKYRMKHLIKDERTCNIPSIENNNHTVFSNNQISMNLVKVSTAQSTQTLATSAISPNELNTIGVGGGSMLDFESETFALQVNN